MKKLLFTLLLSSSLFAQEKATDLFNANVSFIGIGIQYEKALSENFTALGTLDYMGGFRYSYSDFYGSDFEYILTTNIALEGRYYYNFDRRLSKGKNTKNNSGNYIALKGNYTPDWLTTSNSDNLGVNPQGSITLNYGFKRSFAQNFFYEFYTGLGLSLYQDDKVTFDYEIQNYKYYKKTETGVALDLGFRVGYNF
ncbi:hypothetical protein [Empedobacter sp. GD03797]|uniref:hypothetical protein n=1 Tax=Empedobacter sp. GD03797 TaxID=2975382 RepID=UPI000E8B9149|nr:hypothetical protein [Empedobacter sp. GD03797]MDH1884113.1 hypothetical protein [Empedobacter sp. GD03797]HBX62795.1 hypothetical protein [Flavobacteriaceae bacterium]